MTVLLGKLLLIGLGGFVGAISRYIISGFVQNVSGSISFPWGTFAVNVIGCFFIGVLSHLADIRGVLSVQARMFLLFGFLGSFTTFSTFGNETLNLMRDGENFFALVNVGIQVVLGLTAVWLGRATAFLIWR